MDARPQRPLRSLHVGGDENAVPAANKQGLHQKHKSTGTLSTLLGGNGLKMAAKRTAFGELSNAVKNAVRDDNVISSKSNDGLRKDAVVQEKATGFLRPAQRPMNPAGLKTFLNKQENKTSASGNVSLPSQALSEASQARPAKTINAIKRPATTAVFRDDVNEVHAGSALVAPVHQSLAPRHHKSQPQLRQEQPTLRRTQSKSSTSATINQEEFLPAPSIYEDANEEPASNEEQPEQYMAAVYTQEGVPIVDDVAIAFQHEVHQPNRELPALPLLSEPEEYWEEEEEGDEVYDEQGYTTAHSTRGDNTTGGATTVLYPKVTNKVRKELAIARLEVESARTQEEIEDEAWDTSMVAEYGDEIFAYMRELEMRMLPNAHYMDNQAEIQWSMRSVLMDWLIQVHHRFSLLPETLFLCVNYIDRFLSCKIVSLGKLQLVGATAIFVAAKYEEINCPSVGEIVYMVDGGYTVDEILKAERFMLSMLQFELGWPGPMSFLRRISKADDYDLETRTLAKYFLEVTIMDERFVGSPPSFTAAGAHCLARFMLKKGDWSTAHVHYSGYTYSQLRPLVTMIVECLTHAQQHHCAVFEKYADKRYKRASGFAQKCMEQGFVVPNMAIPAFHPSLSPTETQHHILFSNSSSAQLKI